MGRFLWGAVAAASVLACGAPATASTLFDSVTIEHVAINGAFYDVTFKDGSFNMVFPGATAPEATLTFPDADDALAAANAIALRSEFQALVTSTFGGVMVPWDFDAWSFKMAVAGGKLAPGNGYSGPNSLNNSTLPTQYTLATFAPSAVSAVPEPEGWALMIVGFVSVGAAVRARRKLAMA